ncbi:hypothetical protein C2857_006440 [Epichloe festucae Fl1]|uniref:Uncharacterized protein n=1 Tax=Epichloe festucae (strain Fl1) TaxID=877507 RepID=A0A7S9PW86_EPIFF|nr:hypothetical protein C2857_006440 [Epichloe festucae Fl1]
MDGDGDDRKVGWGRRVNARFATPASRNILNNDTTPLSLENTFIGRALTTGNCLEPIEVSSRGQSVRSKRDVLSEELVIFTTSASDEVSEDEPVTKLVEETDPTLFPQGLTLNQDKKLHLGQDKVTQLCHSCGEALPYEQQCGRCGHDFCYKCASERWKRDTRISAENSMQSQEAEVLNESPGPDKRDASIPLAVHAEVNPQTPTRGPVTSNPFFLADRYSKGTSSAPHKATTHTRGSRPRRLSDCIPRPFMDKSTSNVAADKPSVHQDHGPEDQVQEIERHSLCCSVQMSPMSTTRNRQDGYSSDALQGKFGKLCRHAEEFHTSRNTLGHNGIASEHWPRSRDSTTQTSLATASEETPTRLQRRSRLHSLEDDEQINVIESGYNSHDLEQDDVPKEADPSQLRNLTALDHSRSITRQVSISSRSSSVSATKLPSNTGEHGDQESALRPHPLTLKPRNRDIADSSDFGMAQPARVSKTPKGESVLETDSVPGIRQNEVIPGHLVDSLPATTSAEPGLPSLTGYRRQRQDTDLCPVPQTPFLKPEPWPTLRKVGTPPRDGQPSTQPRPPWSRQSLRRVSSTLGCLQGSREMTKSPPYQEESRAEVEDTAQHTPSRFIPGATPVSDWRRNLIKPQNTTPNFSPKTTLCESCNPTDSKRSVSHDEVSERCSHRSGSLVRARDGDFNSEDPFTEPRLSIRAIEHSLAWKKVQEDFEQEVANGEAKVPSSERRRSLTIASNEPARERATTESPPHSCRWRNRYLKLRDEILSSEDMLALYEGSSERKRNGAHHRYEGSAADELGIEALTIVVHMRHQDDLVINTDLIGRQHGGK